MEGCCRPVLCSRLTKPYPPDTQPIHACPMQWTFVSDLYLLIYLSNPTKSSFPMISRVLGQPLLAPKSQEITKTVTLKYYFFPQFSGEYEDKRVQSMPVKCHLFNLFYPAPKTCQDNLKSYKNLVARQRTKV